MAADGGEWMVVAVAGCEPSGVMTGDWLMNPFENLDGQAIYNRVRKPQCRQTWEGKPI